MPGFYALRSHKNIMNKNTYTHTYTIDLSVAT